jgi:hypothetical protein
LYAGHGGHGPVSDTVVPVKYHWFVEIEIRENANVYINTQYYYLSLNIIYNHITKHV